jgi:glycosyltransferase involved in cell wall biosynthesis
MDLHRPAITGPPAVSVIVIFFDAGKFLQEAIDSVLAQTYQSWELLLIDDGSTDESTALARCCQELHPEKTRYLAHAGAANLGKSASRNLGLHEARGQYIAFLDADDVWLPHKLQQQVAIFESQPKAAMLFGRTQYWYSWTGAEEDRKRDALLKLSVEPDTLVPPVKLLTAMLRHESMRRESICPYPSSTLFRRDLLKTIGGFDQTFHNLYDDVVFFAKAFLHAPVYVSGKCWDRYRMHPGCKFSVSYTAAIQSGDWHPSKPNPAELRFLMWLLGYLRTQRVRNVALWASLLACLLPYHYPRFARAVTETRRWLRRPKHLAARLTRSLVQTIGLSPHRSVPKPGRVSFGDLRRLVPISRHFGFDRGQPIDRYYIEKFLDRHRLDVRGRVLEVADNAYTKRFGDNRVVASEVLHASAGNPSATIVGDLARGDNIPSNAFDCLILTQTLLYVFDLPAAVRTTLRILKPGGVVLVTVPGICQLAQPDIPVWNDYWRFTSMSARRLFEESFPASHLEVSTFGNILSAISFLHGLSSRDLRREELDRFDPDYQVCIAVRAVKPMELA